MKYLLILLPFIILYASGNIFAQSQAPVQTDSIPAELRSSEFQYAGTPRVTMDGTMPLRYTKIKPVPTAIASSLFVGTMVALHYNEKNAWWSGQRRSFHFEEDYGSALQVDKFGHAFGGYIMSYGFSEVLLESGFNVDDATVYGSALGLLYQTYVETEDGFATDWGFSPSDWYFDAIGATYFLAQHYMPVLQNFVLKWEYIPTEWSGKPNMNNRPRTFIDDYNSSTFWISANMHNILPGEFGEKWPEWLNVAVGYGADGIGVKLDPNGPPDQLTQRRFLVSLDPRLDKLMPEWGSLWNWWRQTFRHLKIPSPTLEFSQGKTKFYLFYPFRMSF
jgi:hypothetical protein